MANPKTVIPRALVTRAIFALALASTHCDDAQCEALRDELTQQKLSWQDCTRDSDCIKVGGNEADCTGIMSCNFSVNLAYRLTAERRVASLPEETRDCLQCAQPTCVSGDISICEQVSKKCILVTEILPNGQISSASQSPTAGAPSVPQ